jgi:acetyltransferase-like isoleucine patch superfamily enzyme
MKFEVPEKNIKIVASAIDIGNAVVIGKDVDINVFGTFRIGDYSVIGSDTQIRGNNISIGAHLFNSSGLRVGGGGRYHPNADLEIGDRCTIHNNFINVCEKVKLGNDVGLSPETSILTHGYWMSVLDGYPASFAGVDIGDGVIIGYRSLIMMGVTIAPGSVIGAQSVVSKTLKEPGIYAGSPVRFIRGIVSLSNDQRIDKVYEIVKRYREIASYHGLEPRIEIDFPIITIEDFQVNVETFEYRGVENEVTDDFRDYVRKWGIRIYTTRPFVGVLPKQHG